MPSRPPSTPDTPQEVATMDESKKALMKEIFWAMNEIGSRTETANNHSNQGRWATRILKESFDAGYQKPVSL